MPEGICSKLGEGCGGQFTARGLCYRHYRAALRSGEIQSQRGTPAERFWAKVDKAGPTPDYAPHLGPCWIWRAALDRKGYGVFCDRKNRVMKTFRAHRWSYVDVRGPIPDDLPLDHLCRVRRCVNPDHLEPVTLSENIRRGAAGVISDLRPPGLLAPRREYPGHRALTAGDVRYIRESSLSGNWLAEIYGVSPTTISYVRKRRIWKHVV